MIILTCLGCKYETAKIPTDRRWLCEKCGTANDSKSVNVKRRVKMNKKEAIQAMLDGKKVRTASYDSESFLMFSDEVFKDERGKSFNMNQQTSLNGEWEIYQEPKRLVKFFRYADDEISSRWISDDGNIAYIEENKSPRLVKLIDPCFVHKIHGAYIEVLCD